MNPRAILVLRSASLSSPTVPSFMHLPCTSLPWCRRLLLLTVYILLHQPQMLMASSLRIGTPLTNASSLSTQEMFISCSLLSRKSGSGNAARRQRPVGMPSQWYKGNRNSLPPSRQHNALHLLQNPIRDRLKVSLLRTNR